VKLCAIDRDHPDIHEPRLRAQRQNLCEQARQRVLVIAAEPRERRMIGHLVGGDHTVGDIPPHSDARSRVRSAPHERRRTAATRPSSPGHTPGDPTHPGNTPRRTPTDPSPLPRRAQTTPDDPPAATPAHPAATKRLLTINSNEVLGHAQMVLNPPDDPRTLRDSLRPDRACSRMPWYFRLSRCMR
jgi:hypothetical protein